MTPSRPAPSKRRNQSSATARSRVAGVTWSGGAASVRMRSSSARRSAKGASRRSRSPTREEIEEDDRRRDLARKQPDAGRRPGGGGAAAPRSRAPPSRAMTISPSSTQRGGSCARSGGDQLRVVADERLLVAALDVDVVAIAEDQRAEPIPLGLEDPVAAGRQRPDTEREHGLNRVIEG